MEFVLNHRCKKTSARAGVIKTDMGLIKTPIFMPVGTAATVKGIHQKDLDEGKKSVSKKWQCCLITH